MPNIPNPNRQNPNRNTMGNMNNSMSNSNNAMSNATNNGGGGNTTPPVNNNGNNNNANSNGKKGCLGKALLVVLFVSVILVGGLSLRRHNLKLQEQAELEAQLEELNNQPVIVTTPYENTGRYVYDKYLSELRKPNETGILTYAPLSYVQREWSFTNNDQLKQNLILSICSYVNFRYPEIPNPDENSEEVLLSDMLNGEPVYITAVDYKVLAVKSLEDREKIIELYNEKGFSPSDFNYQQEMVDLMTEYLLQGSNYPTKEYEVNLTLCTDSQGNLCVDDTELDRLLFSSDDFHQLCDSFADVIATYEYNKYVDEHTPKPKTEVTTVTTSDNEVTTGTEINQDMIDLVKPTEPPVSTVPPVTSIINVTDEEGKEVIDEEGKPVTEVVVVTTVEVTTTTEPLMSKEEMFPKESIIPYTWIGVYFCENEYNGKYNPEQQVGDGSIQRPAGEGTEIITKALCEDGKYHNVKITLVGCCIGNDAITYIQKLSERNRGWDANAVTQLITYELKIENLDDEEITVKSEMFLSDSNANKTSRVGTVQGFTDSVTLKPKGIGYINDWSTSTELQYKYVCWGSSFARQYPVIWFNLLAGGTTPKPFDASASFVGADRSTEVTTVTLKEIEHEEPITTEISE